MRRNSGFTLIELMVVIAIVAILASLAAPSFKSLLAKKRVEGVMSELVTDLEYARSEAVQRNTPVQVTLGSNCYVIHTQANVAPVTPTSCVQNAGIASTIGSGEIEIKTTKISSGTTASLSPTSGTIVFDPVRGMATISSGASPIIANSSVDSWQLRANISTVGRVSICSAAGAGVISGYSSCS